MILNETKQNIKLTISRRLLLHTYRTDRIFDEKEKVIKNP